jgi:hypothetical protein
MALWPWSKNILEFFLKILIQPKIQAVLEDRFFRKTFVGGLFKTWYEIDKSSERYDISKNGSVTCHSAMRISRDASLSMAPHTSLFDLDTEDSAEE